MYVCTLAFSFLASSMEARDTCGAKKNTHNLTQSMR